MDDETYLLDMQNAATKAIKFVTGISREQFDESELHQSAVVKQLEIVGEAAGRLSSTLKDTHPDVPWTLIVGMRNRLVHDYTRIDVPTVWETVQSDLGPLRDTIQAMLDPLADQRDSDRD